MDTDGDGPVRIDTELLRGFHFQCRPDCGLCCYATPRIEGPERGPIVRRFPQARFVFGEGGVLLAARPNGGACQFLEHHRCRAHDVRPHPCREFPITVHIGHRLQASMVLSCPGLTPDPLDASGERSDLPEPRGLETELAAIGRRLGPAVARRCDAASRRGRRVERRLRQEGRWDEPLRVRERLSRAVPFPDPTDFPVEDPPSLDQGVERLPLFFDGREGPVALSAGIGGWGAIELGPSGVRRALTTLTPPIRPPALAEDARRLLAGYLRYWVDRDAFLAAVHQEMLGVPEGSVLEWATLGLREIGALTLARASVRRRIRSGATGPLSREELWEGIAATDQDWLDRPTWGERL